MSQDKVRFVSDERLDIPDAKATQSLSYEYLDRVLGAIIGHGQGFLVTERGFFSSANQAKPHEFQMDSCLLYQCVDPGVSVTVGLSSKVYASTERKARVIRHDETITGTTLLIDLAAFQPQSTPGWIWGKVGYINADPDTRRKWNAALQTEESLTMDTRERMYISELQVTGVGSINVGGSSVSHGNPPDDSGDWVALAWFDWSGATANIHLVWGLDYMVPAGVRPNAPGGWDEVLREIYLTSGSEPNFDTNEPGLQGWFDDESYLFDLDRDGTGQFTAAVDKNLGWAFRGSQGISQQLSSIRIQLARILYHERGATEQTADAKVNFWGYPRDIAPGPNPGPSGLNNALMSNLNRWNGLPRMSLTHAAWGLGTGDQMEEARTSSANIWIPMTQHPGLPANSVDNQAPFRFGSCVAIGTNTGASDITNVVTLEDNSLLASINRYWSSTADAGRRFWYFDFKVKPVPTIVDSDGNQRKIRFTHVNGTMVDGVGFNGLVHSAFGFGLYNGTWDEAQANSKIWTHSHSAGTQPNLTVQFWNETFTGANIDSFSVVFTVYARILNQNDA